MKVEVFDEDGAPLVGQRGRAGLHDGLSRPCRSASGATPTASALRNEYFCDFPGVWRHGDWAEITPGGGVVIHGRADATLKVNGVRIGTAEIYRGARSVRDDARGRRGDASTARRRRIVLFVVLPPAVELDDALARRASSSAVRDARQRDAMCRPGSSQVPDLLRSLNGKPSEIAIRDAINGRPLSIPRMTDRSSDQFRTPS